MITGLLLLIAVIIMYLTGSMIPHICGLMGTLMTKWVTCCGVGL